MKNLSKEDFQERLIAIIIWAVPWIIIVILVAKHGILKSITSTGSISSLLGLIIFAIAYASLSVCLFRGFIIPHHETIKIKVIKPETKNINSDKSKEILSKFINRQDSTPQLLVFNFVLYDFLKEIYERKRCNKLYNYLPTTGQLKKYPFESLCLMLSAKSTVDNIENGKYYNFDLILDICLEKHD